MKNKKLFITNVTVAALILGGQSYAKKTNDLASGPIQTIEVEELSTTIKDGVTTKIFFPQKPDKRQAVEVR
ncbi:hypothetical protein ACFX5U_20350 [Sphingobacterium sp. SG20118]|uniref:hypothetical protein n=1 Tax=Sphingobacterium sp. SG20118 TaxID=3367156 RepID=UPI0037DFBF6E